MINGLKIIQYAGISASNINLREGLNVIVGPNETGKSTFVEALFAILFIEAKLSLRKSEDKRFMEKAFPFGGEPFAECEVLFTHDGHDYELHKTWHLTSPKIVMIKDGRKIMDQSSIEVELKQIFGGYEATFSHVAFGKQEDFKKVFEQISSDETAYQTVSELLKDATVAFDGLPLERYKTLIVEQFDQLASNWDLERNMPSKGKGWRDPHKKNIGEILKHYYVAEQCSYEATEADRIEQALEMKQLRVRQLTEQLKAIEQRLEALVEIEQQVVQRSQLELKRDHLETQMKQLMELNRKWPIAEAEYSVFSNKLRDLKLELAELIAKRDQEVAIIAHMKMWENYEKRKALVDAIAKLEVTVDQFHRFDQQLIRRLESKVQTIREQKIKLASAELSIVVHQTKTPLMITNAYGESKSLLSGDEMTADAFLKITDGSSLEIEIKSNQIDFVAISKALEVAQSELMNQLSDLNVITMEACKENHEQLTTAQNELAIQRRLLDGLPNIGDEQALIKEHAKFEGLVTVGLEILAPRITALELEIKQSEIERMTRENMISQWKETYGELDSVTMALADRIADQREIQKEIEKLASLPEAFSSVEMYLSEVKSLRANKESVQLTLHNEQRELDRLLVELPEKRSEELREMFDDEMKTVKKLIEKAGQLSKILRVLEVTLNDLQSGSSSRLEQVFTAHLKTITQDKYRDITFDQSLLPMIGSASKQLPVRLLSSGTLDSVALAFRLALTEVLSEKIPMLTVLDDCLINMDAGRRNDAVKLIKQHAERHQLIFVTCHPEIAALLGGHQINL